MDDDYKIDLIANNIIKYIDALEHDIKEAKEQLLYQQTLLMGIKKSVRKNEFWNLKGILSNKDIEFISNFSFKPSLID